MKGSDARLRSNVILRETFLAECLALCQGSITINPLQFMKSILGTLLTILLLLSTGMAQEPVAPPAPASAPAAPTAAAPAEAATTISDQGMAFREMLDKGGVTIYALLALSVVMFALIVYYVLSIRRGTVVSDSFMKTADALIRKQDYLGLLAVCNRRNECIARITQKTLDFATKNPTATFDEVREVTEAEGQRQASSLVQRITYLADVGKVAPLVGLLGTVFGIIKQFSQISQERMLAAQLKFAGGISEALLNTAAGLFIAIPSVLVFSIYRGRVSSLISELEAASTHIMALLSAQYKRVTAAAAAAAAANRAPVTKSSARTRSEA
jgi:biopolymer transport protein ExbB